MNRFGCRKVSITGCLICAVSLTAASFANNLVILYVFYGFFGIGGGGVFVSCLEIVRTSFDKRQLLQLVKVWVQRPLAKFFNLLSLLSTGEIHYEFCQERCFLTASLVLCTIPG